MELGCYPRHDLMKFADYTYCDTLDFVLMSVKVLFNLFCCVMEILPLWNIETPWGGSFHFSLRLGCKHLLILPGYYIHYSCDSCAYITVSQITLVTRGNTYHTVCVIIPTTCLFFPPLSVKFSFFADHTTLSTFLLFLHCVST